MQISDFIAKVKQDCREAGVVVRLAPTFNVNTGEGLRSRGYFDDDHKVIASAVRAPHWIENFIHEYCHFLQWRDDKAWYNQLSHAHNNFYRWLVKEIELPQAAVEKNALAVITLERDCEQRVVKLIKQYDLKLDVNNYVRGANSYLFFLGHLCVTRKWYDVPPYLRKKIVQSMPDKFLRSERYLRPDDQYKQYVARYCY